MNIDALRNAAQLRTSVRSEHANVGEQTDVDEESFPPEMVHLAIRTASSSPVTPEERALGHSTRQRLKHLSTWKEWEAVEQKQLNQFDDEGTF